MNLYSNCIETLPESKISELKLRYENTEGMISFEEALLLYCLAKDVTAGCIVEIGSYRGRSSVFLGRGSIDGAQIPIYAVDPHKTFTGILGGSFGPRDRTFFYKAMLDHGCSEIVSLINLSSRQFASTWDEPVSLLWIDGDHRYEGVRQDFDCWSPHLEPEAMVVFDDALDPNLGPRKLINELTSSNNYKESLILGKVVALHKITYEKFQF